MSSNDKRLNTEGVELFNTNYSTNNNTNNETGTKTTIHFGCCKNNAEEIEITKTKENEAFADGVSGKSTAKESPTRQRIGSKQECPTKMNDKKGKREDVNKSIPKDSVIENQKSVDGLKDTRRERESREVAQGIGSRNETPTKKNDNKDKCGSYIPTPNGSVIRKESLKGSGKSEKRESIKSTVNLGSANRSPMIKVNNMGCGKEDSKNIKMGSIIGNRNTNDGMKDKGRETESKKSTISFASEEKFLTGKNGQGNDKNAANDLVIGNKNVSVVIKGERKSPELTQGFGGEKKVVGQKTNPDDSKKNTRNGESESRKSTQDFDRDKKCLTGEGNSKNNESGRNIAKEKRSGTTDKPKEVQKNSVGKNCTGVHNNQNNKLGKNDKKGSCDDKKNANVDGASTSNSGSEKKDPTDNINDVQGKRIAASTNDNKSQKNAKGEIRGESCFGAEKNGTTGSVNSKSNSGTAQNNCGNRSPTRDNGKRNAETSSAIVSTQSKSANNNKSSVKNSPRNGSVKIRNQTVKNPQNFPGGKKPSLENQKKKDDGSHGKAKVTESGLKITSHRRLSEDHRPNSPRTILSQLKRNSTTFNSAENKNSPSDSGNMGNGGKKSPTSSVSGEDAARKRYNRFMINARSFKCDGLGKNYDRMRYRRNRNGFSLPKSRDGGMLEGRRSPERIPLGNDSGRNSKDVGARKRAFEATGLVVAPPKRICLGSKSTEGNINAKSRDLLEPLMNIDLVIDKIAPGKVIGTTGCVVAPAQKICLNYQSTGSTDKNVPTKVGRHDTFVPKKVVDTSFKAAGHVVAPPKGRYLEENSNSDSAKDSSKKLEDKEFKEDQRLCIAKSSAEDTILKSSNGTNRDKLQLEGSALQKSDLMKESSNNSKKELGLDITKCFAKRNHQRSSNGTNLDKEVAGDVLDKVFRIKNESSTLKKVEDNELPIAEDCLKYNCKKINAGKNLGKVEPVGDALKSNSATQKKLDDKSLTLINSFLEQNFQKSVDGSEVQAACLSLKNSDSMNDMSTSSTLRDRETSQEKRSSKQNIFSQRDSQNTIKESNNPAKESELSNKRCDYGNNNQILVKREHCNPDNESKILINQKPSGVEKNPLTSTAKHEQSDNSLDTCSKIPVSACSSVLSINLSSNTEKSSDVECNITAKTERNTDTSKASLTTDIMQGNKTNNGSDKLKCSPNTTGFKDSIQKDIEIKADKNFDQERSPLKGNVEENTCHVDPNVAAFSTVITFKSSSIQTESEQSENEDRNPSDSSPIPKISDKESLKDNRTDKNQEQIATVSKTVLSKKTSLIDEKVGGLGNSKFILAKLKRLKTSAQKTFKNLKKASVTTSGSQKSGETNSESNGSQQENVSSDESLLTIANSTSDSKSAIVEDKFVKPAENQSAVETISKYFACQKDTIDKETDVGDNKLKSRLRENCGSSKDYSNSNHISTDEKQPAIECYSVAGGRFQSDKLENNGASTTHSNILSELGEAIPNVSTHSQKSLKPGRIPVAKNVEQKADKSEDKENRKQKSALPKLGRNTPDNIQRPVENRTRLKGINVSIPEALPASTSEKMKEGKNTEVFSHENTSNIVSDGHSTKQYKLVCASSETKSSSTCAIEIVEKSTCTSKIAPALTATEEVKRFKIDVPLTEYQPLCVTKTLTEHNNSSDFLSLSAIDLQNNDTRIADINMSNVKQEIQFQIVPTSAKHNSSFQCNASKDNEVGEQTNLTCDSLKASKSVPKVSGGLPLITIKHSSFGFEQVKRVTPTDNSEKEHSSRVDILGKSKCDKITSSLKNTTSTTCAAHLSDYKTAEKLTIEETLTEDDKRCSTDDKGLNCDSQKTKVNSKSSYKSDSARDVHSKSNATASIVLNCGQDTVIASGNSSVNEDITDSNTVKNESKELYLQRDGPPYILKKGHNAADSSGEKDSISVLGRTEFSKSSTANTNDSKEHLIQENRQDALRKSQTVLNGSIKCESIDCSSDRQDVLKKTQNTVDVLSISSERELIPALDEGTNAQGLSQRNVCKKRSKLHTNIENQSLPKPASPSLQNCTRTNNHCSGVNAQDTTQMNETRKRKPARHKENKQKRKKRLRTLQNQQSNQKTDKNVQREKAVGSNLPQQSDNRKSTLASWKPTKLRHKDYLKKVRGSVQNSSQNENRERRYCPLSQTTQEIVQEASQSGSFGGIKNDGKVVCQNDSRSSLKQSSEEVPKQHTQSQVTNNDGNLAQSGKGSSQHDIDQTVNCSSHSTQVVLKNAVESQSIGDAIIDDEKSVQNVQISQDELKLFSKTCCPDVNNGENSVESETCHDFNNANDDMSFNVNGEKFINKDSQNANGGNSLQSGVGFSDNLSGQNLDCPSTSSQEILHQASQSGCQSLNNGGTSLRNDGQDFFDGNLTGDIAIAGKRKRDDESAEVAGSKHQKCQNQSRNKTQNNEDNNDDTAGVECVSWKEHRRQEEERSFLCENILAIEEVGFDVYVLIGH